MFLSHEWYTQENSGRFTYTEDTRIENKLCLRNSKKIGRRSLDGAYGIRRW